MLQNFKEYANNHSIIEASGLNGLMSFHEYMNESELNEMNLAKKVAFSAALIASLATSCRKPIDPDLVPRTSSTSMPKKLKDNPKDTIRYGVIDTMGTAPKDTIGTTPKDTIGTTPKDTIGTNPKDTIGTTPKDTIGTNPKDTIGTNPKDDITVYGNWICSTICEQNPTYEPDKISFSENLFTWYIWGRTMASGGRLLGYNSIKYYNLNTLSSVDQNDETKIRFFVYDKTTEKINFFTRVQGGELIPNKGYIPERVAVLRLEKQDRKLIYDGHIYNPIP